MVELNFLASRKERVIYENKITRRYLLAGLVMALVALFCSHVLLISVNQQKEEAVNVLQQALPETMNTSAVEKNGDSYFSAADVLQLMAAVSNTKTDGVCYTAITRQSSLMQLQGNAWTMAAISSALRHVTEAGLASTLHLLNVTESPKRELLKFTMASGEM